MVGCDALEKDIRTLRSWIEEAGGGKLTFFGGAGVSTESGIPDFRSADGLYSLKYPHSPETMLSRSFFDEHPAEFFDFYFDRVMCLSAKPNRTHRTLARLEREGILDSVVTQNIDGLHQAAGSTRVWELHGSIHRNYCMECGGFLDAQETISQFKRADDGIPRCPVCGGIMKPDVVLYEEPLDGEVLEGAIASIERADVLLVAGTSLAVNPAAGLLGYFSGSKLAIVNKTPTPRDQFAQLCIPASIGEVLDF